MESSVSYEKCGRWGMLSLSDHTGQDIAIQETAWKWRRTGETQEQAVLSLRIDEGERALLLNQEDIRAMLPYLDCFAKTGRFLDEPSISPHASVIGEEMWTEADEHGHILSTMQLYKEASE